eukprot:9478222-Pyramimonas_sp.AAC.1
MDLSNNADAATSGAFGASPYGATRGVRGVPGWTRVTIVCSRWGLRWSSLWGHERVGGVPKWTRATMRTQTLRTGEEARRGRRNRAAVRIQNDKPNTLECWGKNIGPMNLAFGDAIGRASGLD